ncbi:MAG: phosphotransferase [Shimia sp.]
MEGPPLHLWGVDAPLAPLDGGHRNQVFRTVGMERPLVFKSTAHAEEALRWLAPLQAAARHAGFCVPALIPSQRGSLQESGWTCEPFIIGRPASTEDLQRVRLQLPLLHAATQGMEVRPGVLSSLSILSERGVTLATLPDFEPPLIAACLSAWADVADRPKAAIHGDIGAGNVIHAEGGRLALIDWDEARWDLTLYDTAEDDAAAIRARLAWEVATSWMPEPVYARRMAQRLLDHSRA